jgi:hypothetical protein
VKLLDGLGTSTEKIAARSSALVALSYPPCQISSGERFPVSPIMRAIVLNPLAASRKCHGSFGTAQFSATAIPIDPPTNTPKPRRFC